MDFRARFSRLLDLGPSPLASISRVVGWVPRVWGTADPAATRTSRMAGDHRGARPGALVLDRAPAPPAPWLGFPP